MKLLLAIVNIMVTLLIFINKYELYDICTLYLNTFDLNWKSKTMKHYLNKLN